MSEVWVRADEVLLGDEVLDGCSEGVVYGVVSDADVDGAYHTTRRLIGFDNGYGLTVKPDHRLLVRRAVSEGTPQSKDDPDMVWLVAYEADIERRLTDRAVSSDPEAKP